MPIESSQRIQAQLDLALQLATAQGVDEACSAAVAAIPVAAGLTMAAVLIRGTDGDFSVRTHHGLPVDPLSIRLDATDRRLAGLRAGSACTWTAAGGWSWGAGLSAASIHPVLDRGELVACVVGLSSAPEVAAEAAAGLAVVARLLSGALGRFVAAEMERERRFLSALLDHLPMGVFVKDVTAEHFGVFRLWNRAHERLTGVSADEALGRTDFDFFPVEQAGSFLQTDKRVVATGADADVEEESLDSRSLGRITLRTRKTLVRDEAGKPLCLLVICEDVSVAKRVSEELRHAKEAAEAAVQAKSQFLATISHEIRTPMNGVVGAAELLLRTSLDQHQRELTGIIRSSGDHLLALIGDILDFTRFEGGRIDIANESFILRGLAEETVAMVSSRARLKGLEVTWEVDHDAPSRLLGDEQRLRQVMVNLLGNAVKFTERGQVVLQLGVERDVPGGGLILHGSVSDTGIGIEPEVLPRLFEPFVQGKTGRKHGGTGLGLAISRRLIEAMGGSITVHSERGRGTTTAFTVRVGLGKDKESTSSDKRVAMTERHVLLVEDEAINRVVVSGMLRAIGCTVETANDGAQALERIAAGGIGVVVMDIQMPVMDGLEATRRLRAAGLLVPVVGASANAFSADRDAALAAGMDAYLTKPLTIRALAEALLFLPG